MELERIEGLPELWALTKGDPRIKIAILDGYPDVSHKCFEGASIELHDVSWSESPIEDWSREHATHIASQILGQHGSPMAGVAPDCRGLLLATMRQDEDAVSALTLARAIDFALAQGCSLIHIAHCLPNVSGACDPLLERSIREARQQGVLVVAPAGNNRGECYCFPASLPDVLAVGAIGDDGLPRQFSNFGPHLDDHGVMTYGQNMLGARPGQKEVLESGTSCAAPVVTGVCALLLSLLVSQGRRPDVEWIRSLILETASACCPEHQHRCLRGILNIPELIRRVAGPQSFPASPSQSSLGPQLVEESVAPASPEPPLSPPVETPVAPPVSVDGGRFVPSLVFALGGLEVDFQSDLHLQQWSSRLGGDPRDPALLLPYLESHPEELDQVNWILTREDCPRYAIEPTGRYRSDIYQLLLQLRQGFVSSEDRLERISLPGVLTPKSLELHSGQSIPVVNVSLTRGLYGWSTASLLEAVDPSGSNFRLRQAMRDFLERIYADLDNPGLKAPQRALNFAATNIFQAAFSLSEAINQGFELFDIEVDRSPFCRIFSDCWEVKLKFQDPENCQRAYRVHRFTIDVSDILPVTLGSIRSWASRTS